MWGCAENSRFHFLVKALRFAWEKDNVEARGGVLGVGEMGKRHAGNLRRLVPEARLIAIADVAAQRAKQVAEELEIEHAHASLEEMVQRTDIDAVLIARPRPLGRIFCAKSRWR
jgi:predicted homoserine dehydrogenase-like protein